MAFFDLRDRRLELTIAYVGPTRALETTHVVERTADRGVRALLRPHHAPPTAATLAPVLADADGVVLVIDADPRARERNRRAVQAVRAALAGRDTPVVVHVEVRDGAEALPANDLVRELGVEAWPHVAPPTSDGAGVQATLARVIHEVEQTMMQPDAREQLDPTASEPRATHANPLLAALERVLRAAIDEHVRRLGDELAARFERQLSGLGERIDVLEKRACTQDDLAKATAALKRSIDAVGVEVRKSGAPLASLSERSTQANEDVRRRLANLEEAVRLVADAGATAASVASEHATRVEGVIAELLEELKKPKKSWFG